MRSPEPQAAGRYPILAERRRMAAMRRARAHLARDPASLPRRPAEAEGGCGVIGVASSEPLPGKHLLRALEQMRNRGNGKGGGTALVGCFPHHPRHFAVNVGYLDASVRLELEREIIRPTYELAEVEEQPQLPDPAEVGLEIAPPRVVRYFCRARPERLDQFASGHGFEDQDSAEEELVWQTSFALNERYYVGREHPQAFVLSHGRDMMILKGVGYGDEIVRYYRLEEQRAHIWIGHHRYPTKGRVWHPGGAHPFSGLDEALVHNGDFANYHAVSEYLAQRGYYPQFITDTEVGVLLFDLYNRVYRYPLEVLMEAMAPTTERDFLKLPPQRRHLYRAVQRAHLHGSPDGPWFFIIARTDAPAGTMELIGITDTSMLRPQVFALQEGELQVGVIASERQAIDALLESLAAEDSRTCPLADGYWNARGGSHSDGGAFTYRLSGRGRKRRLVCVNKFEERVEVGERGAHRHARPQDTPVAELRRLPREEAIRELTRLGDAPYAAGEERRSCLVALAREALEEIFLDTPGFGEPANGDGRLLGWVNRKLLEPPGRPEEPLYLHARGFAPEGEDSAARWLVRAHQAGWRRLTVFGCQGHRFLGCGLGPRSQGTRIDVYGASGDYLGSGLDGAEIHVHGDGQDQLGQIMTAGKLVIHGSVGQTFLYGAKGGVCYVKGSAAGRPLINAVGRIRALINGTALDYAAESFMAGEETGGGFLVIHGVEVGQGGELGHLPDKYPGANLFSLASGGACYILDPEGTVGPDQLNEAHFTGFGPADWEVLEPYLRENELHFGIPVEALLRGLAPERAYRKIVATGTVLLPSHE